MTFTFESGPGGVTWREDVRRASTAASMVVTEFRCYEDCKLVILKGICTKQVRFYRKLLYRPMKRY